MAIHKSNTYIESGTESALPSQILPAKFGNLLSQIKSDLDDDASRPSPRHALQRPHQHFNPITPLASSNPNHSRQRGHAPGRVILKNTVPFLPRRSRRGSLSAPTKHVVVPPVGGPAQTLAKIQMSAKAKKCA